MEWSDVTETVGKVAPAVGGALGGPMGAAVGGVVARALGVPESPEAVAQAVRRDPEATLKLREVEARIESSLIEQRASVVTAEAQSESWLARNWRPLTMLWFVFLIGLHWLGFTPDNLNDGHVESVLKIIQYGLTGYVAGRSVEKTAKIVTGAGLFDHLKAKVRR